MRPVQALTMLAVVFGIVGSAMAATKTFTLKDGSVVRGTVIDEGETHYLVKTDDGATVRVPYSEIGGVAVDEDATAEDGAATDGESPPPVEPVVPDVFQLREQLMVLLGERAMVLPRDVAVLDHGVRYRWGEFAARSGLFCPGGLSEDDGRCPAPLMRVNPRTTHWREMTYLKLVVGDIHFRGRVGYDLVCVAHSPDFCLAIMRNEEDAATVAELVRSLANLWSD
jgi:hypothetical protein